MEIACGNGNKSWIAAGYAILATFFMEQEIFALVLVAEIIAVFVVTPNAASGRSLFYDSVTGYGQIAVAVIRDYVISHHGIVIPFATSGAARFITRAYDDSAGTVPEDSVVSNGHVRRRMPQMNPVSTIVDHEITADVPTSRCDVYPVNETVLRFSTMDIIANADIVNGIF